jgi:hypothetical protein
MIEAKERDSLFWDIGYPKRVAKRPPRAHHDRELYGDEPP